MRQSTKTTFIATRASVLIYRAALPLSSGTLNYAAGIIRRHRKAIGSCWRKLNPARQALLVLAYLRKGETLAELAAGFEVGTTTAWRYVNETTELLVARAPKLRQAVRDAKKASWAYVVLDGTLIPIGCSWCVARDNLVLSPFGYSFGTGCAGAVMGPGKMSAQ